MTTGPPREPVVTLTRTTLGMRLTASGFRFLFRAFAHVRTSGLDGLPQAGPLIVVANHTTLADPPFVAAWLQPALGRPLQFLAKEQLFVPLMKPILHMFGAILVRAGGSDVEAYRSAVAVLRGGGVVAIFPEGTRSLDGAMREPHAGVALIAARSGVPILPVGHLGRSSFPAAAPPSAGLRNAADASCRPAVHHRTGPKPRSTGGHDGGHGRDHAPHRRPGGCRSARPVRRTRPGCQAMRPCASS